MNTNKGEGGALNAFLTRYSGRVTSPERFSRELLVCFYLAFFVASVVYEAHEGSRLVFLLTCLVQMVYVPGMFFASGYLVQARWEQREDFRRGMLFSALTAFGFYVVLSVWQQVHFEDAEVLRAIRNIVGLMKMPGLASILLTLAMLFLVCAALWERVSAWMERPLVIAALCVVGFLFIFVPDKLIGYGLLGVFIGGDQFGCTPIATGLFAFFWGAYAKREEKLMLTQGRNLFFCLLSLAAAIFFVLPRMKEPCLLFLGMIGAFGAVNVAVFVYGIYEKIEAELAAIGARLWRAFMTPEEEKTRGRVWSVVSYLLAYTVLFALVAWAIFCPFLNENKTLIWEQDALGQYVPKVYRFLSYIPEVFRDLLHGNLNFKQYDFTSGLGSPVAISYDPIYWLNLLFGRAHVEAAYSFLIMLRYYLAGLSMGALVLYFKKSRLGAYAASLTYAFCGYALFAGTRHGQFLNPMILLPLLVIAMEELIRKKKWKLMTVVVAVSLLCSYYFLYMNTIILGIYFVLRILCTREYRNVKTFFGRGLLIVGSYVLGACIGCISIFTSFGSYLGSSRTGESVSGIATRSLLFYRREWITDMYMAFISNVFTPGYWLKFGFAPLALFAVMLLFTRKNRRELRWLFVITTAFCIFPVCGYIFSGFSTVSNRWCYIYAALIAFVVAEGIDKFRDLRGWEMGIVLVLTAFYGLVAFLSDKLSIVSIYGAFGLLALTAALVFFLNSAKIRLSKQAARHLLLGLLMVCIFLNGNWFVTTGDAEEETLFTDAYVTMNEALSDMSETALTKLDKVPDLDTDGFCRSTNLSTPSDVRSSSLIYGYNDLSTFTSTLAGSIVNYNRAMGNTRWTIVSVTDYNGRTYMNALASVKYLGVLKKSRTTVPYGYEKIEETEDAESAIYENKYALPLGYTYDSVLSESEAAKYSAAEKQELTMLTAIVGDENVARDKNIGTADDLPLTAKKLGITDVKAEGGVMLTDNAIEVTEEGAKLTLYFDGEDNAETYLALRGDLEDPEDGKEHFMKIKIKAAGTKYNHRLRIDTYSTGQEEYLFHLGYHEKGIKKCVIKFKAEGTIRFDDLAIYSQSMDTYADRIDALKENSLQNVKTGTNEVAGTVTVDKDKMLVITLPYQNGWTAYVDGEKADIQCVNYQYMGLNLEKGSHTVRLVYQQPGIKLAFAFTVGGVVVFAVLLVAGHYRRKRKKMYREV